MNMITWVIGAHALIWGICLGIIVFLAFRRMKIKKSEDFEDRDN